MIVFSFAIIWVGVLLGSIVTTPEGVQGVAFVAIFPITFVASTFVPTSTLPGVLKTFAEWNPVTSLSNALRHLFDNPGGVLPTDGPWPLVHPVAYTLLWAIGIVLVCGADLDAALPARDRVLRPGTAELIGAAGAGVARGRCRPAPAPGGRGARPHMLARWTSPTR